MRSIKCSGVGLALLALVVTAGCAGKGDVDPGNDGNGLSSDEGYEIMAHDTHSQSRPRDVRVTHVDFDWVVDFDTRVLSGTATYSLTRSDAAADEPLYLDARHLEIRGARAGTPSSMKTVQWAIDASDALLGDRLVVALTPDATHVALDYATTPTGTGLQWLEPAQTAGRKHPFLFSQSQAIHARTWFPCQDSPGVRMTYRARVRTRPGLQVVMSAERTDADPTTGTFQFDMPQAVPSYLVALAVGDIEFRELGPRSGVWAEPSVVDAAADEFADTEKMIDAVESLYGPYRWGRYDILVLPPSFPFGGMENPRLTFATPTILAGDRSLIALIAHELAHSWSGNLVTNATWRDFWLNEGFTVYLEHRIMEQIFGAERFRMEAMLGQQDLDKELAELPPIDHVLHVDLSGRDPDDGFTNIPYEKGAAFLHLLENTFGRAEFDAFLRRYFDANAFRSMTTEAFREILDKDLFARFPTQAGKIDVEAWIEGSGLPEDCPRFTSDAFVRVDEVATAWLAKEKAAADIDTSAWIVHQWLHFLRGLAGRVDGAGLTELDQAFALNASKNSEITFAWLELVIKVNFEPGYGRLREFLTTQGRRKFLKPLYLALAATPAGKKRALDIYREARSGYHSISQDTIDEVLGYQP